MIGERVSECTRLRTSYPRGVPVVILKDLHCICPDIQQHEFSFLSTLNVAEIMTFVRDRLKLGHRDAIFVFAGSELCVGHQTIKELYQRHVSDDGFLYLVYSSEEAFG
jgi:GABA(A) receptor-associated protein